MEFPEGRGKPYEPVAVETESGWVLSGPMRHQRSEDVTPTQVNLVTSVRDERIESEVQKLCMGPRNVRHPIA